MRADILRAHRKAFVRAAGDDFEARLLKSLDAAGDESLCRLNHLIPILFNRERGADGMDAEDACKLVRSFFHRLHGDAEDEHATLFAHNLDAKRAQRERDAFHEAALKIRAV